jgi:hypothetical protein
LSSKEARREESYLCVRPAMSSRSQSWRL